MDNTLALVGELGVRRVRPASLWWKLRNLPHIWPGLWRAWVARACGMSHIEGRLYVRKLCADGSIVDYGLAGTKKVTTAFVQLLVDNLQAETTAWGDFKYHDCGTGTTAESVDDAGLVTAAGTARATGTQTEGAAAHIYKSVGTIAFTSSKSITEHGLFNASTGGTLMDSTVLAQYNMVNGESLEFTFTLTVKSGG